MSQQTIVFPAPAGINRIKTDAGAARSCVPRASGDKPVILANRSWRL
ncbi:hypothetical protein H8379_001254 [Salmonella enterica subsp. enterica serovar Montevideo]|nr:hypothetical protein [Salmonella enterica subsp. enterica serovar Montevideo]EEN6499176.1 hypothetical protein [Salmonella enterica subsp. enterica]EGK4182161.1 hypothetical protein [Salmonella enterica]EGN7022882.1 hypothetical protein [Salmonella enterica subsp. enterica serovar Braenderup]EGN7434764.1 hypothetical protein [Salmonella enterica subsp. enterica serovar Liverpool]